MTVLVLVLILLVVVLSASPCLIPRIHIVLGKKLLAVLIPLLHSQLRYVAAIEVPFYSLTLLFAIAHRLWFWRLWLWQC